MPILQLLCMPVPRRGPFSIELPEVKWEPFQPRGYTPPTVSAGWAQEYRSLVALLLGATFAAELPTG